MTNHLEQVLDKLFKTADGPYFEDMWLSLENDLSSFDSFIPSDYVDAPSSSSSSEGDSNNPNTPNLEPQTYEDLLQVQLAPPPSNDQLRSPDRKERIQAIRELYNKTPTIINGSVDRLTKIAERLYNKGYVKEGNFISAAIDKAIQEDFSYVSEEDDRFKSLNVSRDKESNDVVATVEISDKTDKGTITRHKTFDNVLDAIKYFKSE